MKYLIMVMLIALTASCAGRQPQEPDKISDEYKHLEKRVKSESAVNYVRIGQTGAIFYFDGRLWSVKSESDTTIEFAARRFTNARIFIYDQSIPLTQIYAKLAQDYDMKNAKLVESEYLTVNDSPMLYSAVQGTVGKRDVSILSYAFSKNERTVVAHCFIFTGMLRSENRQEIIEFLNGLDLKR
jgi:hypothetical protein